MTDSGSRSNLTIEDINMEKINKETSSSELKTFVVISAVIIVVVNIPIIRSIMKEKNYTFINILVLLDCVNSLAHIPILAQYF